ncbi:sodium/hydrogen exchanger 9B2-like [Saccostrea cucullata]|uniref:sodium/hydrogen exchanger 9B2-like n=1 Tax=Saccostrea cuccullata TaxID=36930 RepID=UPI002ED59C44
MTELKEMNNHGNGGAYPSPPEAEEKEEKEENLSVSIEEGQPPSRKCAALRSCFHQCSKPVSTKYHPLSEHPGKLERFRYAFMCPPHGNLAMYIQFFVMCAMTWAVLIAITKDEALPGGNFFSLVVLFTAAVAGGYVFSLFRLPPLLGMLIVGGMLSNIPVIKTVGQGLDLQWSGALRKIALTVILIRAGLGLDPVALRKLSFTVLRLAFTPCLTECLAEAIASHFLLGLPWEWGFMLGFVLAAVSPAVVVPSLLNLSDRGYGLDKGIPTLVIAAASVDDVLAITGFGVVLGIAFTQGDLALTIVKGPLEALLGVAFGCVLGVFLWYFPSKNGSNRMFYRSMLLFAAGLMATFGSDVVHLPGAGPLGCLTLAFVAAFKWRKEREEGQPDTIAEVVGVLWMLCQPLLFGLIGAAVNFDSIKDLSTLGLGIAVLAIGLVVRIAVSFCVVFGSGLTIKEQLFVALAWFPKATVQAAIGGLALDAAIKMGDPTLINLGTSILTTAVLSIIITAPIGALAIALSGPLLLNRIDPKTGKVVSKDSEDPEKSSMLEQGQNGNVEDTHEA